MSWIFADAKPLACACLCWLVAWVFTLLDAYFPAITLVLIGMGLASAQCAEWMAVPRIRATPAPPGTSFPPLKRPDEWPPPCVWSKNTVTKIRGFAEHFENVLQPIAVQICEQLSSRPEFASWPGLESEVRIARIVADTVKQEKMLDFVPALDPNDPFGPLFWGPFDDLTPLLFRMGFEDEFGTRIPDEIISKAWNGDWTIKQFIEECDAIRLQHETKTVA